MASTNAGAPEAQAEPTRLTSRQRRIEEQRRKIETMRAQQQRKRLTWGGLIVLAVAIVVAGVFVINPFRTQTASSVSLPEQQYPSEGRDHVPQGTVVNYKNRPPSSGSHYDTPAGYQFYARPIEPGFFVHTLEHGGIALLWRPDLCDQACVTQLQQVYGAVPTDGKYNLKKMTATAFSDMDHKIAVVAWQWVMNLDDINQDQIMAFYREHVDRGPEDIP